MTANHAEITKGQRTIGDYVAGDYRTAGVFEKYGIDFCCGGQVTLDAACREKGLDPEQLRRELETVKDQPLQRSEDYARWSLPFLIDYIVNTHHVYLRENDPLIITYTRKITEIHGARHSEVIEIAKIFDRIAADLERHLKEEEDVFFPAVKRLTANDHENEAAARDRALVKASLAKLYREHEEVGDAVHRIRHLAGDYTIPPDVCNTFVVTYRKLKEFEEDLHKHVHLENNILFFKAGQL